jgi:hypothetical protein
MKAITINGIVFQVNSVFETVDEVSVHLDVNTGYIILVNVIEQGYKTTEEFINFLNS